MCKKIKCKSKKQTSESGRLMPRQEAAFTILELLAVIAIILLLVALLVPVIQQARAQARKTRCVGNFRNFAVGIVAYKGDNNEAPPLWLSSLYPHYIPDKAVYVCPQDSSVGHDGGRPGAGQNGAPSPDGAPDEYPPIVKPSGGTLSDDFVETDDTDRNAARVALGAHAAITRCSYMYEFANIPCSWTSDARFSPPSPPTWHSVKLIQQAKGYGRDPANFFAAGEPWDPEFFPIVRCFYHWEALWGKRELVLNVSLSGHFFLSKAEWERGVY